LTIDGWVAGDGCILEPKPTAEELIAHAERIGFAHVDALKRWIRPAVALRPHRPAEPLAPAATRIGGRPALPSPNDWPRRKSGLPLSFLAQIDLAEIAKIFPTDELPQSGLLSFFYNAAEQPMLCGPDQADEFEVLYFPERTKLALADMPDDFEDVDPLGEVEFNECAIRFESMVTLPPWESAIVEAWRMTDKQQDKYFKLQDPIDITGEWSYRGILLGHPDQIQGDIMLACAFGSAGWGWREISDRKGEPEREAIARTIPEWRLLLQIHSVDEAGMTWGDVGCLYYCIKEKDLRARNFDAVWLKGQCS
jgi:uncharacterized protein YwqG